MTNEQTSKSHEPQHAKASSLPRNPQPMKSAMKIPRSSRRPNGALPQTNNDSSLRYIPRGLSSGHGGIVYPSNPNNSQAGNGYVSPEWGWYITMTPPTPDMYHNNKLPQSKKTNTQSSLGLDRPGTLTNPAFKTGSQKTAMGWPSVPL
mmetsp:Transcript_1848/g.2543  ORF Transcript_1848/g.2543 Transcript_1848/m.2543 type:complete len:148 (-) Transcript_1848:2556-2999(-)